MNESAINEDASSEDIKPKKKKGFKIHWKMIGLYFVPAFTVFIIFFLMHGIIVQPPLTREEIKSILRNERETEETVSKGDLNNDTTKTDETPELPQGSDIPFIGPQHYYHSFTGALATDLRGGSGILTIEIAVSIFMGKLNADTYFESFKNFEPALRSVILALMRTKSKDQLDTNEGKETLKIEILDAINKKLSELGADPEIRTVQFTRILLI